LINSYNFPKIDPKFVADLNYFIGTGNTKHKGNSLVRDEVKQVKPSE